MGDRIAGAQAARAQLARDARLRKQIILRAYAVTGNMADANDLAQQAMMRAIDPEGSPWDPAREPSLLVHLGSLINSRLANLRRGAGRHPVDPFDEAAVPTDQPGPEASILARDARAEFEAWLVELQRRLDGDGIALAKLDLALEGVDRAEDQAARLGCSLEDIRSAARRIAYHARIVKSSRPRPAEPRAKGDLPVPAPEEGSEP